MGCYGPSGSGKTFTALLFAEGLAKASGKRIAFIDTERGTDFYVQHVKDRKVHPDAFDIDTLYTKSITDVLEAVKSLDPSEYAVVVIDSITHIWEAARLAYAGKETKAGTIPFHAWGKIKKPYKDLINILLSSPMHVIFCGRQGNEFEEDEESGELKKVGVKMKAEGETPYEPHILIRMESVKNAKDRSATITAFAEKDRTGVLAGRTIEWPGFDNVIKPILSLLGDTQAKIESEDETSAKDAERLSEEEKHRIQESEKTQPGALRGHERPGPLWKHCRQHHLSPTRTKNSGTSGSPSRLQPWQAVIAGSGLASLMKASRFGISGAGRARLRYRRSGDPQLPLPGAEAQPLAGARTARLPSRG